MAFGGCILQLVRVKYSVIANQEIYLCLRICLEFTLAKQGSQDWCLKVIHPLKRILCLSPWFTLCTKKVVFEMYPPNFGKRSGGKVTRGVKMGKK